MGDSSCSGSTPFKSLVQHGAQDRSLHQDRISSASGIHPGFRSSASTLSNSAQDAFGSFLTTNGPSFHNLSIHNSPIPSDHNGFQTPNLSPEKQYRRFPPSTFHSAVQLSTPVSSGNPSGPLHQHQASGLSPGGASNWAQDFARFSQGVSNADSPILAVPNAQHYQHRHVGFSHNMSGFPSGPSFLSGVGMPATTTRHSTTANAAITAETDFDLEMGQWMAAHGDRQIDDVDAVMEELARQMEQDKVAPSISKQPQHLSTSYISASNSTLVEQQGEQTMPASVAIGHEATSASIEDHVMLASTTRSDSVSDTLRVDPNEQTKAAPIETDAQEQSEISEAARQILESVQHEKGDKWKNSRFLLLMRDFRDGNKDIVNNEILETHAVDDHAGQQVPAAEH